MFFNLQRDAQMDIAAYVAKAKKLFSDFNTELRRRESHDIPLNCCLGRSSQHWDLSTRNLTSGVARKQANDEQSAGETIETRVHCTSVTPIFRPTSRVSS